MSGMRRSRGLPAQTRSMSTSGGCTPHVAQGMAGGAYNRRQSAIAASSMACMWSSTGNRIGVGAAGRLTRPGWRPPWCAVESRNSCSESNHDGYSRSQPRISPSHCAHMVSQTAHSPPQTRHTPASAGLFWLVCVGCVWFGVGWDSLFCSFICSIPSVVVVFWWCQEPGRKVGFLVIRGVVG